MFLFVTVYALYSCSGILAQSCSPIVQYTNLTINGNTISNVAGNFSDCCQYCQQKSNCVAYSWYNGTCILKSSAQPLYKAVGYLTAVLSPNSNNTYSLQTSYNGSTFFNNFTFISYTDPSGGDVNYTTQAQAQSLGLVQVLAGGQVYIGVDNTTIVPLNATRGRAAVRIQSKPIYNSGLFIFNLAHMPEGLGTWPAFWSYANPWPYNGEIDILEAIYTMPNNQISLHTSQNCTMPSNPGYINGAWGTKTTDCFTNYTAGISGCSIEAPNGTFGSAFNQAGGGVFAMEWDRFNFIRIWNFVQPNIPSDIASGSPNPNPSTWGLPNAYFPFGQNCSATHFNNQTLVINTDLCGSWVGSKFPGGASNCSTFVRSNPQYYSNAYYLINSLNVYCKPNDPYCVL